MIVLILIGLSVGSATATVPVVSSIAFSSCLYESRAEEADDAFRAIERHKAPYWIWLGDMVYVDTDESEGGMAFRRPGSLKDVRQKFEMVRSWLPAYQRYWQESQGVGRPPVKLLGMWDDHDCGKDECDASYPYKEQVRDMFLSAIHEPMYSQRRTRPNRGIYDHYYINEDYPNVPLADNRLIHVALMDLRTFRDAAYHDQLVGEEQWAWLERVLSEAANERQASWTLLGSSVTVLPVDIALNVESWDKFPEERFRLLNLIEQYTTPVHRIVLLSGDIHEGAIFYHTCPSLKPYMSHNAPGQEFVKKSQVPFWEMCSSGLTHSTHNDSSWASSLAEKSRFKACSTCEQNRRNYGVLRFNWARRSLRMELWPIPAQNAPFASVELLHSTMAPVSLGRRTSANSNVSNWVAASREDHCIAESRYYGVFYEPGSLRVLYLGTYVGVLLATIGLGGLFIFFLPSS